MRLFRPLALVVLAAIPACSKDDLAPPRSPAGESSALLRLLGQEEVVRETLLSESLHDATDYEGWYLLRRSKGNNSLTPLKADDLDIDEYGVRADRYKALVRFFDVPAGRIVRARFRIKKDIDKVAEGEKKAENRIGKSCLQATVMVLNTVDEDGAWRDLLTEGVRMPKGTIRPAADVFDLQFLKKVRRGKTTWVDGPDEHGYYVANLDLQRFKRDDVSVDQPVALSIVFDDHSMRLGSVLLEDRPTVMRTGVPEEKSQVPLVEEATVMSLEIGDEHRRSVVVPGGSSHECSFTVPESTYGVTVGLAGKDGADWRVDVDKGDGTPPVELAGDSLDDVEERWGDRFIPWSDLIPAGAEVALRLHATGDDPVAFGQPIVRSRGAPTRPNLLFISIDTLRSDHLGCYGYKRATSPFLDDFAESAARFSTFYSVGPYTLPTHATMFTGLYPPRHGAVGTSDGLVTKRVDYLPRTLSDAGYATAAFTSGGFLSPLFGFADGFDRYGERDPILTEDDDRRGDDRLNHDVDAVVEWVEQQGSAPWFAFVHTFMVHEYIAPEEDIDRFDTDPEVTWDDVHKSLRGERWLENPPSPGDIQKLRDLYDATIHYADRRLKRLHDRLAALGALDNTVIVVTSDHGEEFYEHGRLRHSATVYEEMLRVPLIVRHPGQTQGRVIRRPTSQVDLAPTVFGLLGLDVPEGLDGHDLSALIRGERAEPPNTFIYSLVKTYYADKSSLRHGEMKVIRGDTDEKYKYASKKEWQLYDVHSDPEESDDLTDQRKDSLRRMSGLLRDAEDLIKAHAVRGSGVDIDPELQKRLDELGY